MNLTVEFIAHIRELTGAPRADIEIDAAETEGTPVRGVLRRVEELYAKKNLRLLAHNDLIRGLLIFKRKPNAGLTRVTDLDERLGAGESLAIGTGMEGG